MGADFIVAFGTILLALAAFSQVEESKRQIENSIKQLRLLREQTELLRKQVEAQEAARLPKLSIAFKPINRDGETIDLVNNSTYEIYWRVGCIVPWPEGVDDPALIDTGDCLAYIEPEHECSGRSEPNPLKIEPGDTWCFKVHQITALANQLFGEPDATEWLLALVIEVAYPLSSTGEARCVYKLKLRKMPSNTALSGFMVTVLPGRPICAAI